MDTNRRTDLLERVEKWTEIPMMVLAAAMVPLLLGPLVTDLPSQVDRAFLIADWCIWGTFAIELVAKTYLSASRWGYLRANWLDVLIVAIPLLRPLRIIQSARVLRLLRLARLAVFLNRAFPQARLLLVRHGLHYVLVVGLFLVLGGAILVTTLERSQGGEITSLGDGVWWAMTTISTVGYGDTVPTSVSARMVGMVLMLGGVAVFSAVTANVAAFFVSKDRDGGVADSSKLDQIIERLERLERTITTKGSG